MLFLKHFMQRQDAANARRVTGPRERALIGLMLVAVLGFNLLLTPHEYDLKLHQSGDHCVTCDLLQANGHGVAPTPASPPLVATSTQWFKTLYTAPSLFTCQVYSARAPPNFSRV